MFNKVFLKGRIAQDVNFKSDIFDGLATFSICVPKTKDKVDFFNCKAYGKTACLINEYVKKGESIIVVGSIQNFSYTNKNGVVVKGNEIICKEIELLGIKEKQEAPAIPKYVRQENTLANEMLENFQTKITLPNQEADNEEIKWEE